ncbi:hypothetical protein ABH928_006220 [Streptacidiphilus sp. MAP5-3]
MGAEQRRRRERGRALGVSENRPSADVRDWWRDAVCYQVYLRSFADGNGDGVGDLAGLHQRLPYLAGLGVDALWINPWFPSPMVDGGYDVADDRAIDPVFGTMFDARAMIEEIHALGLRLVIDIVPNHTSAQHPWLREALAGSPDCVERDRYIFRPGVGPGGDAPPNNWRSVFGGSAWTRIVEPDGRAGTWYLHLFAPEQPDLNWDSPLVRREFESILRFWFDLGVDGIRIDVAHAMIKAPGLPDLVPSDIELTASAAHPGHPLWDREGVHEIFRGWRAVADSDPAPRVFLAEACVGASERLARYVRADELHTAFNFDCLTASWRADTLPIAIDSSLRRWRPSAPRRPGCSPTTMSCATSPATAGRSPTARFTHSPTTPRPVRSTWRWVRGVRGRPSGSCWRSPRRSASAPTTPRKSHGCLNRRSGSSSPRRLRKATSGRCSSSIGRHFTSGGSTRRWEREASDSDASSTWAKSRFGCRTTGRCC